MKPRLILIVIIILIIAAIIAWWFLGSRGMPTTGTSAHSGTLPPVSTGNETQSTFSPVDPAIIPKGSTISLGTAQGTVAVNNFYKMALGYDGEALVLQSTPQYEIFYNEDTSAFGIYIVSGPEAEVRTAAENSLLSTLGVTRAQLCKLKASEVIAASLDPAGGVEMPLALCTNALGM